MSIPDPQPALPKPGIRWYRLTPDRAVIGLLIVECVLWLSERFGWLAWYKGYAVLTAVAGVGVAMLLMLVWFAVALIFRLRFQFGIRSLLVLTLVAALPSTWLAVEMKKAREQEEAIAEISKFDGVIVEYELDVSPSSRSLTLSPTGPTELRQVMGNQFFARVYGVVLHGTRIADTAMGTMKRFPGLMLLDLSNTQITDAGLEAVKELPTLISLDLDDTQITDCGLGQITGLPRLQVLWLDHTLVTDAGVKRLQQALPNCKIER